MLVTKRADEIIAGDILDDIWMCFESRPYLPNPDVMWLLDWRFQDVDGNWVRVHPDFQRSFVKRDMLFPYINPRYVIQELGVAP